jgi:glutaminase
LKFSYCFLFDRLKEYSGHFAFEVGMPAKSSASGAIMVVVPNILGYCVWSPLINTHELSLKGIAFCEVT